MSRSIVSFRMEDTLRDLLRTWAQEENRTISNYIESLLLREGERRDGKEVTLDSLRRELLDRIDRLRAELPKPKERKDKVEPSPRDIVTDEDEVLAKESWIKWLEHVRKMAGHPLNYAAAMQHYKEFCRLDSDGYNCDTLVKEITDRYTWKFPIIPNDWKREKVKGGY